MDQPGISQNLMQNQGNIFGYLAGKDTMRILVGAEEMHGLYMDSR